ncbi:MAG: Asp-tRNA(Asn)/Glu-tRNA(Gln) amidotransferase subunit GatB [Eubacteriales bacterium]|nr:Asp-tRNA(Asn)/Glu-tRNA(Gln) amidotransferase subunit GatB [Eubacteriales bacterium]
MQYETVIGLEVHVELSTASKIFCSCETTFGGDPNTHCCPVCTGLPGALPVLNEQVVDYAIRTCLATNCTITPLTRFDRKNYFYPDLPKAYQISQLHQPIGRNGFLDITTESGSKRIEIHEIHMEEDAGKLIHDPWEDCTLVDYNRCGVPLLEIVSEPDLRSAEEALAYLEKLRSILQFLGVSDCRMEQGSLRADVNVSVRPVGSPVFGTRTEMKNMNSFKAIGRAIVAEAKRQIDLIEDGKTIRQETRRWDENKDSSFAMRSKEDAMDYRYFPDPDLVAINITPEWIERVKANLHELPESRRARYLSDYQISAYEADVLTTNPAIANLFEQTVALSGKAKDAASWMLGEFMLACKDNECEPQDLYMPAQSLATLITRVSEGVINRNTAKKIFAAILDSQVEPNDYIKKNGLRMVSNPDALKDTIAKILTANPQSVSDFKAGKTQAKGFLVGQVMKAMQGKADPQLLNQLLQEALEA